MTTAVVNHHSESPGNSLCWQALSIVALIPAGVYATSTIWALISDSSAPTKWLRDLLAQSSVAVFGIWPVLLGGPVLSLIASLILERPAGGARFQKVCTAFAWILLLWCLVTTVPFPWFFLDD